MFAVDLYCLPEAPPSTLILVLPFTGSLLSLLDGFAGALLFEWSTSPYSSRAVNLLMMSSIERLREESLENSTVSFLAPQNNIQRIMTSNSRDDESIYCFNWSPKRSTHAPVGSEFCWRNCDIRLRGGNRCWDGRLTAARENVWLRCW